MLWMLIVAFPPMLVIAGCGPTSTHAAAPPSSATATQASGDAVPADPARTSGDDAPIDQSCPTSNTIGLAKPKFVAHAGLACGAFHRCPWKPLQAERSHRSASGRFAAFVKGGLAPLAAVGNTVQAAFDSARTGDGSGLTA